MGAQALTGQVALVTGGSRGLGAGIASGLAARGAEVAIVYRSDAEAAARVLAGMGRGSSWQADVRDADQMAAVLQGVMGRHGRLDVVVANAGVWRGERVENLAVADWQMVLDASLTGAFNVVRASVHHLRASGAGRIIVISSAVGLIGFAGDAAYASAKAGLIGFVRSISKELGRDGITVNAVAPGFIETDMTRDVSDSARERMLRRTSIQRAGNVDDVVAAVSYLATDAPYVTGQTLVVDGGLSL